MKLYLGSATPPFHPQHLEVMGNVDEWTAVDLYVDHPQVKKWDVRDLPVDDNSVDAIYASHLLEHLPHVELHKALIHWNKKLRVGGKLILNVPDLLWACSSLLTYVSTGKLEGYYNRFDGEHGLLSIFYGSQSHDGEYHKAGFIKSYLYELLKEARYRNIVIKDSYDAHDMGVLLSECQK